MDNHMDIFTIILSSGPVVKGVLILLIFASIISWAIILNRKKVLRKIARADKKFYQFFKEHKSLNLVNDSINNYQDSSLAVMFQNGFIELTKIKNQLEKSHSDIKLVDYMNSAGIESIERSLKTGANAANTIFEKRLSFLATIGSVTPFIGLFGTVWGIINSFSGLASGGGSIEAVAPGIAEALVATAVGLFAAIPAVWLYNIFNSKIVELNSQMDSFAQDFLNSVQRDVLTEEK
ncbi:MAG: MotA/TolQ/ExbB proton channel family protein [Bacteriovoracaceae bacterium]|jgi:biopolymer transport protein TolQ|nr:MotA/TolQ/ExbB proton channel family protein [Bacteriovoracaceae bacterium]